VRLIGGAAAKDVQRASRRSLTWMAALWFLGPGAGWFRVGLGLVPSLLPCASPFRASLSLSVCVRARTHT